MLELCPAHSSALVDSAALDSVLHNKRSTVLQGAIGEGSPLLDRSADEWAATRYFTSVPLANAVLILKR